VSLFTKGKAKGEPVPAAEATPIADEVAVIVFCPPRWQGFRPGFWAAGKFWPVGETRARVTHAIFDAMTGEIARGESILSVTVVATGERFEPRPNLPLTTEQKQAAAYAQAERDRRRVQEIKARLADEEAERRLRERNAAAAETNARRMAEEREASRLAREAERTETARILAAEDERLRKQAEAAVRRDEAAGIFVER
jgi:hypothetical protein